MEQKNAITHSVSGLKNEIRVLLKKQNDVTWSFRSAQLYLLVQILSISVAVVSVSLVGREIRG